MFAVGNSYRTARRTAMRSVLSLRDSESFLCFTQHSASLRAGLDYSVPSALVRCFLPATAEQVNSGPGEREHRASREYLPPTATDNLRLTTDTRQLITGNRHPTADNRQPTADNRHSTADNGHPTADNGHSTAGNRQLTTGNRQLTTENCLSSAVADVHHVAIFDDVVFAFEAEGAAGAGFGFGAGVEQLVPMDGLGANEVVFEIRVDRSRGVHRL